MGQHGIGGTKALKRRASCIVATPRTWGVAIDRDIGLLLEMHDWEEEVVVDPELLVDLIEGEGLLHRVEPPISDVLANKGRVLLLDQAIVIALIGAATREFSLTDSISPEPSTMVIEEG